MNIPVYLNHDFMSQPIGKVGFDKKGAMMLEFHNFDNRKIIAEDMTHHYFLAPGYIIREQENGVVKRVEIIEFSLIKNQGTEVPVRII